MGTRYLQDDEYLLRSQRIQGNEMIETGEFEALYQMEANKKFPFIPFAPYVWIYNLGEKSFDSAKIELKIKKIEEKFDRKYARHQDNQDRIASIERAERNKLEKKQRDLRDGNIFMRWGEPLSVFSEETTNKTRSQMQLLLESRGYFNAAVEYKVQEKGRRKYITYQIEEDYPHKIDSFRVFSSDSTITRLVNQSMEDSEIHPGESYNQQTIVAERERVEKLLKNNGYFDFSRQYIAFDIIMDKEPYILDVNMIINQPARRDYHKKFTIDSVIFVTDASTEAAGPVRTVFDYQGVSYQYYKKRFSKKVLDQRVLLAKGESYSLENTVSTQRLLAYLNNFKFININYDTTGGKFIANIFTSPLPKYQMTNEVGLNVTEGYPGPFYNLALTDRNIFGGLENLEISGYFGFEGVASATTSDVYSSVESGGKLALVFPQFVIPASRSFKKQSGLYNPRTIFQSGFNYTKRPEYTRSNFTNSLSYGWQKERKRIYNFTLSEISLINSVTRPDFDEVLQELDSLGNPLIKSFEPSFVSAMNFSVIYNFNPNDIYGNKASLLRLFAESGGAIFNLFEPDFLERSTDTLQYFQYVKMAADFRRHISTGAKSGIATHLNIGLAVPYGKNKTLPYEKFYFAGGSSSVRAWAPRRLGPGSFPPRLSENPDREGLFDYSVEKPGEILLEANAEFRSKLIGFIDWAFFVDAGNVWKFSENPEFPGADFKFNRFYKEIAVGMGLGLRLNFSFLVIRFDYGIKMYDPARPEGERWIGDNLSLTNWRGEPGQAIWNIAIGYPF
jgi:outer membrane protein insertion porin family